MAIKKDKKWQHRQPKAKIKKANSNRQTLINKIQNSKFQDKKFQDKKSERQKNSNLNCNCYNCSIINNNNRQQQVIPLNGNQLMAAQAILIKKDG